MKFIALTLVTISIWAVLVFGQLSLVASAASPPDITKQINTGLCAGSNLDLSGKCAKNKADATRLNNFIRKIVNILSAIVGVVAVIMIIYGGFRYITSGGNDTSVTSAKNTILYAIIGLVVVALSQIIVHFVLGQVNSA